MNLSFIFIYSEHYFFYNNIIEQPEWAKKGKVAETLLKKTDGGEKIFKGEGDLAKPITDMKGVGGR